MKKLEKEQVKVKKPKRVKVVVFNKETAFGISVVFQKSKNKVVTLN